MHKKRSIGKLVTEYVSWKMSAFRTVRPSHYTEIESYLLHKAVGIADELAPKHNVEALVLYDYIIDNAKSLSISIYRLWNSLK